VILNEKLISVINDRLSKIKIDYEKRFGVMNQLIGKEQLHIQKKRFNELDINDSFFDSLKKDYNFGKNEFEV